MTAADDAKARMIQFGASYLPSVNPTAQTTGQGTGNAWVTGMPDWVRSSYENQGTDTSSVHNWTAADYKTNGALIDDPSKAGLLAYGASFFPSVNPTAQTTGAGLGTPFMSGAPSWLSGWGGGGAASGGGSSGGSSPSSGGGGAAGGSAAGGGGFDLGGLMSMFSGGGMGSLFSGGGMGGGGMNSKGGNYQGEDAYYNAPPGMLADGSMSGQQQQQQQTPAQAAAAAAAAAPPDPVYAGAYTPAQLAAQNNAADYIYGETLKNRQDTANVAAMDEINARRKAAEAASSGTGATPAPTPTPTPTPAPAPTPTPTPAGTGSHTGQKSFGGWPSWPSGGGGGGLWDAFQNVANQFNQSKSRSHAQPTTASGSGAPAANTPETSGSGSPGDDGDDGDAGIADKQSKRRSSGLGMSIWGF